jgi:hypothetical protein
MAGLALLAEVDHPDLVAELCLAGLTAEAAIAERAAARRDRQAGERAARTAAGLLERAHAAAAADGVTVTRAVGAKLATAEAEWSRAAGRHDPGGRWSADRGEVVVWQVTRPIPVGKAVTAADLRRGAIAETLAQGALRATTDPHGQVARVPIAAGALLTPDVLTRGPELPGRGEALVGIALGPGAAPADGLAAGDVVRVVRVPVSGEEAGVRAGGRVVLAAAPVWAARAGKQGAITVTLRVATPDADLIAGLSARGAIALERIAAGAQAAAAIP